MAGYTLGGKHLEVLRDVVAASEMTARDLALPWELLESLGMLLGCDEMVAIGINYRAQFHYFRQLSRDHNEVFQIVYPGSNLEPQEFWRDFQSSTHLAPWIPDEFTSVTKPTDFMSEREWRNLPLYVEHFREGPKTSHELMMCLPDGKNRQVRILFWRHSGRDFSERERFELQLLMPHVEAAYRRGERLRSNLQLTARQHQLLQLVAEGYTNMQIGRRMDLAEGTVRTHLDNIYSRLGVRSRTEAVTRVLGASGPTPAASNPTMSSATQRPYRQPASSSHGLPQAT
jgi:DNA-binding CsgD family transcriptional regulator